MVTDPHRDIVGHAAPAGTSSVPGGGASAHSASMSFVLAGVGFSASGREIVHPLDLSLAKGRLYGLVGPNGSGKSTLLRMLARQLVAGRGAIRLGGESIGQMTSREFARLVAYMPQFTPPAESMTVRELVALGRFPWHGALGRFSASDALKVEAALEQTSIADMAGRMVDSLSGGERQRVWLAMMVAQDTDWLLLDEPTSALDIAHQVQVLKLIRKLCDERGSGIVIVIHDINLAARFCDEILALREGRIVAGGRAETMLDRQMLQRIYGVPMGIVQTPEMPVSYVL